MKLTKFSKALSLILAVVGLGFHGCKSSSSVANQVLVSVSPSALALVLSQSSPVTATVSGATDTSVAWTCAFTDTTTTVSSTGTLTSTTTKPAPCPSDNSWGKITDPSQTTVTFTAPSKLPAVTVPASTFVTAYTITLTSTANADKKKTATATITLDSGIRVTLTPTTATLAAGSSDSAKFVASSPNETKPLNWFVTQKPSTQAAGTTFTPTPASTPCTAATCGSVDPVTGIYKPPATLPTDVTVYVVVNSVTDTTRYAFATITLIGLASGPETFTSIVPDKAPWGGQLQDVYLIGNNLRSSTGVTFNGKPVDPSQITVVPVPTGFCTASSTLTCPISSLVTRLRLNAANLSAIPAPGDVLVAVAGVGAPQTLHLLATRPAIVEATPDSFPGGTSFNASNTFHVNGGYFGLSGIGTNLAVKVQLNGSATTVTTSTARQLMADLSTTTVPTVPGLYPVAVIENTPVPPPPLLQPMAVTNLAIQPTTFSTAPASIPLASSTAFPSAIAVDSNLGYAAVAETGTNQVEIFSLAGGTPAHFAQTVTLGMAPTGIAIDDQLQPEPGQHLAVVANNGDGSLSFIEIPSGKKLTTSNLDLSKLIPPATGSTTTSAPYSVGIDPFSHLALVAFNASSVGFVVQLDPSGSAANCLPGNTPPPAANGGSAAYCAIASVSLNTGATPQIAFEPRLHQAFVSPGGRGNFSAVNLSPQKSPSVQIVAAPGGAVRVNNIVTIQTVTPHGIDPIQGGSVIISNLPPGKNGTNFNGAFQILGLGVIDSTTFSFAQTAVDDTGGSSTTVSGFVGVSGGSRPFQVTSTAVGIAVNPETRTAAYADPNATSAQIGFINSLDQNISSLTLSVGSFGTTLGGAPEAGARFVAYQPYSNVAVSFNPLRDEISFLDPAGLKRIVAAVATGQTAIPAGGATTLQNIFGAMAVDPQTNLVLIANAGSNTLTYLNMGARQNVQISNILPILPSYAVPNSFLAQATLSTNSTPTPPPLPANSFRILGRGFSGPNVKVRLDQMPITTPGLVNVKSDNEIDFSIPATPEFTGGPSQKVPRVFALDVVNDLGNSNVTDFTLIGSVDMTPGCTATNPQPAPSSVAIDEQRDLAFVTNPGCAVAGMSGTTAISNAGTVSIVDLNPANPTYAQVLTTFVAGAAPTGVAVIPRLGYAAVTNNGGTGTVTVFDYNNLAQLKKIADVAVGTAPSGVAIDQDTGLIFVANTGSNNVSVIDLTVLQESTPGTLALKTNVAVDVEPMAIAIDPARKIAVVTALQTNGIGSTTAGVLDVINFSSTPVKSSTQSLSFLTAVPTGIVFDPVANPSVFYATSSLANAVYAFNPDTSTAPSFRVGINPTSIAYNPNTGALLTVNSISNTISLVDTQTFRTRATMAIGSRSQFAAAVHSRTNLAVIADQQFNRLLLIPLPK